ncbi:metal ABC transporter substrate-binding protein [Haloferax sp. DFSO52]|uniref:metal ABC transporter substrate-binding protein n=1 Tax=Haloferax sp. DFSO52 TaxID=3388505 RepID=UPI003A8AAE38
MRTQKRRAFLAAVSTAVAAGVGGCLGSDSSARPTAETLAAASFFVFGDIAANVAGDGAVVETLVPVGQHGHGWEPGPDVQGRVIESDIFVHGMPSFQPWVDDVLTSLDADDAAVLPVDIAADIDLHEASADEHDHDAEASLDLVDPHFWMDPLRVVTAITTLSDAFQTVDESNADVYAESADAYRTAVTDLDAAFESGLETRERDVILVAGHDAFGYLSDRYGFDVVALSGVSPDDAPSPRDIERAQMAIEEHGIRYVLADPLESDRAAMQLVAETTAEGVLPLTSIPGLTSEWVRQQWGYLDIMRETNLPSLRTALETR